MSPVELQSRAAKEAIRAVPHVPVRRDGVRDPPSGTRHGGDDDGLISGSPSDPNQTYYNSYTVVSLLHVVRLEPVRAQCGRDQRPGRLSFPTGPGPARAITAAWRWRRRRRTAAPSSRRWCTPTASRRSACRTPRRRPVDVCVALTWEKKPLDSSVQPELPIPPQMAPGGRRYRIGHQPGWESV